LSGWLHHAAIHHEALHYNGRMGRGMVMQKKSAAFFLKFWPQSQNLANNCVLAIHHFCFRHKFSVDCPCLLRRMINMVLILEFYKHYFLNLRDDFILNAMC
jgi:hypothetical protein